MHAVDGSQLLLTAYTTSNLVQKFVKLRVNDSITDIYTYIIRHTKQYTNKGVKRGIKTKTRHPYVYINFFDTFIYIL